MEEDRKRIVFLIEEDQLSRGSAKSVETLVRHIQYSIFRLLNYYRNLGNRVRDDVVSSKYGNGTLWGYKIYNSRRNNLKYNIHTFYELTVESYNKLEEYLTSYVTKLKEEQDCDGSNSGSQDIQETEQSFSSVQIFSLGAIRINTALSELITDFQWDRPELLSPERGRKKRKRHTTNTETINYIFNIAKCPWCCGNITQYFGKNEPGTVKELMQALIPKDFCRIPSARLNWIDTGQICGDCENEASKREIGHRLLSELLQPMHGALLSVTCISSWWIVTPTEADEEQKQPIDGTLLECLPVSSILESLLHGNKASESHLLSDSQHAHIIVGQRECHNVKIKVLLLRLLVKPKNSLAPTQFLPKDTLLGINNIFIIGWIKHKTALHLITTKTRAFYCIPSIEQGDSDGLHDSILFHQFIRMRGKREHMDLIAEVEPSGNVDSKYVAIIQPWDSNCCLICVTVLSEEVTDKIMKDVEPIEDSSLLTCGHVSDAEDENKNVISKSSCGEPSNNSESYQRTVHLRHSIMQGLEPWFHHLPTLGTQTNVFDIVSRLERRTEEGGKHEYRKTLIRGKLKDLYHRRKPKCDISNLRKRLLRGHQLVTAAQEKIQIDHDNDEAVGLRGSPSADALEEGGTAKEKATIININTEILLNAQNEEELLVAIEGMEKDILEEGWEHFGRIANKVIEALMTSFKKFHEIDHKAKAWEFMKANLLYSAKKLKSLAGEDSADSSSRHIFQVFMWIEAFRQACDDGSGKDIEEEIVKILQSVSFLKNPEFVVNVVRLTLYPRYGSTMPQLIRGIFDGLMLEYPEQVMTPSKASVESDPFEPPTISPPSIPVIDESSVASQSSNNRRLVRRLSSIGDISGKRREIAVPFKKGKAEKSTNRKAEALSFNEKSVSSFSQHSVRRDLFETKEDESVLKTPEKSTSASADIAIKVKNTPVHKQTRKLVWKLQQRERRRSQVEMDKTVICESPLKQQGYSILKSSPLKRSKSFSSRSSPKRFYRLKRLPSCIASANTSRGSKNDKDSITSSSISKISDRIRTCPDAETMEKLQEPFQQRPSNDSGAHSSSSFEPSEDSAVIRSFSSSDSQQNEPKRKLEFLSFESSLLGGPPHRFTETVTQVPVFNEDSMDWIAMIEEDRKRLRLEKTFSNGEFDNSPTEDTDASTLFNFMDSEDITTASINCTGQTAQNCTTPTQSPHVRDLFMPSPRLSASSLEILENAPILSPELLRGGRKTVSGRTFTSSRRGKRKKELPESPLP